MSSDIALVFGKAQKREVEKWSADELSEDAEQNTDNSSILDTGILQRVIGIDHMPLWL